MAQTGKPSKPKSAAKKPVKTTRKPAVKKPAQKSKKQPDKPQEIIRYCSFCKRPSSVLRHLIAGPNNAFICEECVEVCVRILFDISPIEWQSTFLEIMANPEIKTAAPPRKKKKQQISKKGQES
jgi:hypothetical protein